MMIPDSSSYVWVSSHMGFLHASKFAFFVVMVEKVVYMLENRVVFFMQTDADTVRGSFINPRSAQAIC